MVILSGFGSGETRLRPQHYSDLIQAALLAGRAREVTLDIVCQGAGQVSAAILRQRGEEVGRQLAFCFKLTGLRPRVRVGTAPGAASLVEIRMCAS